MPRDWRLAEAILHSSWRGSIPHFPTGRIAERDGIFVAMTGIASPANNPGFVITDPSDPHAALQWGISERGALGDGYDLPVGRYPQVERALADLGHVYLFERPAMLVPVAAMAAPAPPAELVIEKVTTQDAILEVARVQAAAFNADPEIEAAALPLAMVTADTSHLSVGRVDGLAVACALATRGRGGVAVFGVATQPQLQGRGYGTAVTAAAVRGLAQVGDHAVLQASQAGYPVYASMGFEDAGQWAVWVGADAAS